MGQHFWARGYFVSTVGRDEAVIREYIRSQEQEDSRLDQMNFVALIGHLQVVNKCRVVSATPSAASSGPIPKLPALPGNTYSGCILSDLWAVRWSRLVS